MKKIKVEDACEALGLLCVSAGCFLWAVPIGFIVTGISLVSWGIAAGRKR